MCGHGGGHFGIPSGEGVAFLGGIGDGCDCCTEGVGADIQGVVAVHVGDGVGVGREDGHVVGVFGDRELVDRVGGDFDAAPGPVDEGVSGGGRGGDGGGLAVVVGAGASHRSALCRDGGGVDDVGVQVEVGGECGLFGDREHVGGIVGNCAVEVAPVDEVVSGRGNGGQGDHRTVVVGASAHEGVASGRSFHGAAVVRAGGGGDGVGVDGEVGGNVHVSGDGEVEDGGG